MDKQLDGATAAFKQMCQAARNEDEVKRACNIFFHELEGILGIEIASNNEKTAIHGGRADSIYNDLYFELKKLGLFGRKKGLDEALYGRNEHDHGIFHYLVNYSLDDCCGSKELFEQLLLNKVGIAFDGKWFVFCRFRKNPAVTTQLYDPVKTKDYPSAIPHELDVEFEVSAKYDFDMGVKRVLMYIQATRRKQLTSAELCRTFASDTDITQQSIHYLYGLLNSSIEEGNMRIATLYGEWHRIFGTIYEKQVTDFVKHVSAIANTYHLGDDAEIDVEKALFVIQTYYSIIVKLLIQNLFHSLQLPLEKTSLISDKSDLMGMFYGSKDGFDLFISNFFEIGYFEWFTYASQFDASFINEAILKLDEFETTASIIKPEIVTDVLRETYENLMPKELRHMMGEYYTVDWLADFTIEHSGYQGGEEESVLDPTCGSGIFLTHLIKRYHQNYADKQAYDEHIGHIVNNFVGFDINPIAVIQAKGNYILALGDITKLRQTITIPVYMCDSILVPTVHAKQRASDDTIVINTSVGEFRLPMLGSRAEADNFLMLLSECIFMENITFEMFEERLSHEYQIVLADKSRTVARDLYNQLLALHLAGKDGFWPVILKNSFAPLFCKQKFDCVIGNPPWIAWKAMSESYQQLTLDIWLSYGIFEKNAYDKITSHDDFAMAVTYVVIDHYLKDHGTATLILPQTFVKSLKGGEGFRKFCITRDGQETPFCVNAVFDMLHVNPFKGIASNKTSVYRFKKNEAMVYPMNHYDEYRLVSPYKKIDPHESYSQALEKLEFTRLTARPVNADPRSPWLTVGARTWDDIQPYLGESCYAKYARKGIEPCGAKGVYLVEIQAARQQYVQIANLVERSRQQEVNRLGVHKDFVEREFIYPMVGGRNIKRWGVNEYLYMAVPHDNNTGKKIQYGVPVSTLMLRAPRFYRWLNFFHDILLKTRKQNGKFFDEKEHPWYRLDNVGPYTFSPYKVVWQEQGHAMKSCVLSTIADPYLGEKMVVTDSKVLFLAIDDEDEAHYLCAMLNSKTIETVVQNYTINTNRGTDIVRNVRFPKYDATNEYHRRLAALSKEAHAACLAGDGTTVRRCETAIDQTIIHVFAW